MFRPTLLLLQLLCFRVYLSESRSSISASFVETFGEQSASLDDKRSLRCAATGSPLPMITWTLDGQTLESRKAAPDLLALRRAIWGDFVVSDKAWVVSHINLTVGSIFDGGLYACTASNSVGVATHSARLRVHGPSQIRAMPDRTVTAGQSILLPCWVVGDEPEAIHWHKDGRRVPFNHRQRVHQNGSLEINSLDKLSDSGTYNCSALSGSLETAKTAEQSMQLLVKEPPVIEDFKFDNKLQAGMRTRVYCNVAQGDQPVRLQWAKDGRIIQGKQVPDLYLRQIDEFSLALVISNLAAHHNGNYSCIASNEAAAVNHTSELLVNVPPSWLIEPRSLLVVEGTPITIDCMATGFPIPQVTWKRLVKATPEETSLASQQYQLVRSGPHYQVYENGTLRITRTLLADRGGYLCQASNGVGPGLSTMVQLTVNIAARFESLDKQENLTVHKGQSLALACQAYGDQPITIEWSRQGSENGKAMSAEPRFVFEEQSTSQGLISRLNISRVTRHDSTSFKCVARNAFGSDEKTLHVRVEEAPEAPSELRLDSPPSSRSLALRWLPPYNGNSPLLDYLIMVRREDQPLLVDPPMLQQQQTDEQNVTVSGNASSTVVRNLQPARRYSLRVFARNSVSLSASSKSLSAITDEEAPGGPPTSVRLESIDATSIKVMWLPPRADLANGDIKGYYIGYKIINSSSHFVYKTVQPKDVPGTMASSYSLLLQGLQPYTQYVIILQAFNGIGAGPRSDELVARTGESAPTFAPSDISCTALSSQNLKISWSKLALDKVNGFLQGYKVQYRPVMPFPFLAAESELSAKTEIVREQNRLILNGLHKYCNYSVKVSAFTSIGDGPYSDDVYCKTNEDVPGPPASVKAAVAASDAVIVSWREPLAPNGVVRSYTVFRKASHDEPAVTFTVPRHMRYHKASGLVVGKRYNFWVSASTGAGEGAASSIVAQTVSEQAQARIVTFGEMVDKRPDETLELSCMAVGIPAPTTDWRFNGESVTSGTHLELLLNGALRVTGLRPEDSGNYTCHARNVHGSDAIGYSVSVGRDEERERHRRAPLVKLINSTAKSISVEWKARSGESFPLLAQEVYFKNAVSGSEWKHYVINERDSNGTFAINNLSCGSQYQIYMLSVTGAGKSAPSEVLLGRTSGREPLASPASVFVSRLNRTAVRLNLNTWRHGGCPLLEGNVQWRSVHAKQWSTLYVPSLTDPIVLAGLSSEHDYKLRVSMKNTAGTTTVEYETRTSPFKIANVMTHRSASESPELISVGTFSVAPNDEDSPPQGLIITSFVTLLLLLVALLSVIVLYKTIQKKFSSNPSQAIRSAPNHQSITKVPFIPNNAVSQNDAFGGATSELAVLATTLDSRAKCKPKMLRNSASDSGFNMLSTFSPGHEREPTYQYLTITRRPSYPKKSVNQMNAEYSVVEKRDNSKTAAKQTVAVSLGLGMSTQHAMEHESPRYSTPKPPMSLQSPSQAPSANVCLHHQHLALSPSGEQVSIAQQDCGAMILNEQDMKSLDCPCCSSLYGSCAENRSSWQHNCDYHGNTATSANSALHYSTILKQ